jgi:hypothetical protein
MSRARGSTTWANDGAATSSPSDAASTEIAGVRMLSPRNSAAPTMAVTTTAPARRPPEVPRRSSEARARMPPSPSLSAESSTPTWRVPTMTTSAHTASEVTPYTSTRAVEPASDRIDLSA